MSNPLRLAGTGLCLLGIAFFVYALASGDRTTFSPGAALCCAGAVVLIAAARRSRTG